MATKWPQGDITATQPATVLGGNNISGVYTLDQLNRLNADFGPQMQRSLRFRSSASAYLNRTPASAGSQTTWTWSGWVKRGTLGVTNYIFCARTALGTSSGTIFTGLNFTSSDTLNFRNYIYGTGEDVTVTTSQVFRDPSAWYHIALALDTTQGSSSNRVRMYVNGVQVTAFSSATYPSQNEQLAINYPFAHQLARQTDSAGTGSDFYDGYWSEINFIDGQALDPSYFGKFNATTGVWQPNIYTGAYGTNGFRLTFANNTSTTTLGYDSSPNGNNWTTNNISLTSGSTYDSMLDVPTNWTSGDPIQARGNYAVLNPLMAIVGNAPSNANLREASTGADTYTGARATFGISSGKWYWEQTIDTLNTSNAGFAQIGGGVCIATYALSSGNGSAGSWGFQNGNGAGTFSWKFDNGTGTNTYTLFGQGDIAGFALDMGAGTLDVYRNNTLLFTCSSSLSGNTVFPYVLVYQVSSSYTAISSINFGQRPFAYTPPSGYKALNTQNLSMPTIYNGANYMAATLYTGTGATQSIVNSGGFQPDFVWLKGRSVAYDNGLFDVIRGTTVMLSSNSTGAEGSFGNTSQTLTAFGSGGFTVGSNNTFNQSSATFVGWQWKANGTAVTNNAGSITSQVSANTTAGFSVITWTGTSASAATIGHGLGVAPDFVFIKQRNSSAYDWVAYHSAVGAGKYLLLNQTNAAYADADMFNNTAPTSSVITLSKGGDIAVTNPSGGTMVAYCFAAIPGYSAFGSYTGNGSSDGPFVFLGFRPRWIMVKGSTVAGTYWAIYDTSRNTYNVMNSTLAAQASDAEYSYVSFDAVANGFKIRNTGGDVNTNGQTYIYACFAENPFKYSLAR